MHKRFGFTRLIGLAVAPAMLASLVVALPAEAATVTYRKSGRISSTNTSFKRYLTYAFPVSGTNRIDADLTWTNDAKADLNIILKNSAGKTVANTTTNSVNPERLSYETPASATGKWKIVAFARLGTATFDLNWSVEPPGDVAINQPPNAAADSASTATATAVTIDVLANDTDADGPAPLSVGTVTDAANGLAAGDGNSVTYTPDAGFAGTDTFTYTACDAANACSPPRTVTVTVAAETEPPTGPTSYTRSGTISSTDSSLARSQAYSFPVAGALTIAAELVWTDDETADLNVILKNNAGQTVANTTTNGVNPERLRFDTPSSATGTWKILAFARLGTATFDLTWTVGTEDAVPEPAPTAAPDSASTRPGAPVTIDVLANDTGAEVVIDAVGDPAHGTVANDAATVTYKPGDGYLGEDSFSYRACNSAGCDSATVTVTVREPQSGAANYLKVFAAQNIGNKRSYTQAEADEVARNFSRLVATPAAFKGKVPGMHAVNPDLKVVAYVNAAFVGKSQGPASGAFPASWYMRDAGGNPVQSKYDNYMMDVSNLDWVSNRKNTCKNTATASGYDGCSLDMLGTAPLDPGYTKALPVNPATNKVWTAAEYYEATSALAHAVETFVSPDMVVDGNGMRNGIAYFDPAAPAEVLYRGVEQAIAEAFVRPGPIGINSYRNESSWKKDVDMLADADAKGHGVGAMTKVWTTGTAAQKDAWHEYALATFLLGTGGQSTFYFSYDEATESTAMHPWWLTDVGVPAGAYPEFRKVGTVYTRTFENAAVLVNPTTADGSIALPPGNWRGLSSGAIRTGTVTVPAHAGWVMVRSD